MRERTRQAIPDLTTAHLAPQNGTVTLCDESFAAGRPSAVVSLYVPIDQMQSLSDACPQCKAVARRLQAASAVLTLRVVMARPARTAPRGGGTLALVSRLRR